MALVKIGFILLFVVVVFVETRHVHPKSDHWIDVTGRQAIDMSNDHSTAQTGVADMKSQKLSPLSSILFFKSYDPCEDGFKLDFQGICREVWF